MSFSLCRAKVDILSLSERFLRLNQLILRYPYIFLLSEIVIQLFLSEQLKPTPIILNHEQPRQCVVLSEWILSATDRLKYILCIFALRQLQLFFLLETLLYLLFNQFQV